MSKFGMTPAMEGAGDTALGILGVLGVVSLVAGGAVLAGKAAHNAGKLKARANAQAAQKLKEIMTKEVAAFDNDISKCAELPDSSLISDPNGKGPSTAIPFETFKAAAEALKKAIEDLLAAGGKPGTEAKMAEVMKHVLGDRAAGLMGPIPVVIKDNKVSIMFHEVSNGATWPNSAWFNQPKATITSFRNMFAGCVDLIVTKLIPEVDRVLHIPVDVPAGQKPPTEQEIKDRLSFVNTAILLCRIVPTIRAAFKHNLEKIGEDTDVNGGDWSTESLMPSIEGWGSRIVHAFTKDAKCAQTINAFLNQLKSMNDATFASVKVDDKRIVEYKYADHMMKFMDAVYVSFTPIVQWWDANHLKDAQKYETELEDLITTAGKRITSVFNLNEVGRLVRFNRKAEEKTLPELGYTKDNLYRLLGLYTHIIAGNRALIKKLKDMNEGLQFFEAVDFTNPLRSAYADAINYMEECYNRIDYIGFFLARLFAKVQNQAQSMTVTPTGGTNPESTGATEGLVPEGKLKSPLHDFIVSSQKYLKYANGLCAKIPDGNTDQRKGKGAERVYAWSDFEKSMPAVLNLSKALVSAASTVDADDTVGKMKQLVNSTVSIKGAKGATGPVPVTVVNGQMQSATVTFKQVNIQWPSDVWYKDSKGIADKMTNWSKEIVDNLKKLDATLVKITSDWAKIPQEKQANYRAYVNAVDFCGTMFFEIINIYKGGLQQLLGTTVFEDAGNQPATEGFGKVAAIIGAILAVTAAAAVVIAKLKKRKEALADDDNKLNKILSRLTPENYDKEVGEAIKDVPNSNEIQDPSGSGAHHAIAWTEFKTAADAFLPLVNELAAAGGGPDAPTKIEPILKKYCFGEDPDNGKFGPLQMYTDGSIELDDSGAVWPTDPWYKDMKGCNDYFRSKLMEAAKVLREKIVPEVNRLLAMPADESVDEATLKGRLAFVNAGILAASALDQMYGWWLSNLEVLEQETSVGRAPGAGQQTAFHDENGSGNVQFDQNGNITGVTINA